MERPRPQMGTHTQTLLRRIGAFIVDAILVGIVLGIIIGAVSVVSDTLGVLFAALSTVAFFAYFIYMEGTYGQTIGKKLFDIVVVTETGGDCDMRAAAIRNVLRIVDGAFGYLVGLIVILITDNDQRVGDLLGDTVVARVE